MRESELFDFIIKDIQDKKTAYINYSQKDKPKLLEKIIIDLGQDYSENTPFIVNFAFKSVFVQKATDTSCILNLKPISKESHQPSMLMKLRDSWSVDYPIPKCFLHWDIQPGKSMEILFFAESDFRSGSQLSITSGGVNITEGISFTRSVQTLAAATATSIFAQNSSRTVSSFINQTLDIVFVGEAGISATGATRGWPVAPGEIFQWRNVSQLFGYSSPGGDILKFEETI